MTRFIFIPFSLFYAFAAYCQTVDSASIKNDEAKKRILLTLRRHEDRLYSSQNEFDFIRFLKPPEKIDYGIKISYKETQEEKATRKWKEYKNKPPAYPTNRKENYFFDY